MIGLNANVRIEYKGFLEDGTVFDSSELNGPAEFVTGSGQIIEGLDAAIQGMDVGETAMFHIPAKAAYGEYSKFNIQKRDLRYVPNADQLPVGKTISFYGPEGQKVPAKVLKIEDGYVYLDFNHRLAGKDLDFEVTVTDLLPNKTRHTPLSSYGAMGRTPSVAPMREELVFNNSIGNLGLTSDQIKRLNEEAHSRRGADVG